MASSQGTALSSSAPASETSPPPPATSSEGAAISSAPVAQSSPPPPATSSEGAAISSAPLSQSSPPPPATSSEGAATSSLAPVSQSSPPPPATSSEGAAISSSVPVSQSSPPPLAPSSEGADISSLAPVSQSSPPPPATSSEGVAISSSAPVSQSSPPPPPTSSEGADTSSLAPVSQSSPPPPATSSEGAAISSSAPVSQSSPPPPATSSEGAATSTLAPESQSPPPPPATSSEGAAISSSSPVSQSSPPPPATSSEGAATPFLASVSQSSPPPPETPSSVPEAAAVGGGSDVGKVVSEGSRGSDDKGGVSGNSVGIGGSEAEGDAKGVNLSPMEPEGSVPREVVGGAFGSETFVSSEGDAVGIDKGSLEAERLGLGEGTNGFGEVVEKGVTVPEAEGGGEVAKGDSGDVGVLGDELKSSQIGGMTKGGPLPVESSEVASEPSKGSIASDVGGENHKVVGDGGTGEVEALVQPKQVSLDSLATGNGESMGKEAEQLVPTIPESKATVGDGEVRGASKTVAEDVNGDREPSEISSEVHKGTVDSISDSNQVQNQDGNLGDGEDEGLEVTDSGESNKVASLQNLDAVRQLLKDLEEAGSVVESSNDFQEIDGQIATDSDEDEVETDEDGGGGREVFDAEALAALLRAATGGSTDGGVTTSPSDASRVFSVDRPAGLGSSVPSRRSGPARAARLAPPSSSDLMVTEESENNNMGEEEKALHEKVDRVRVKFLRLVHRLGHSSEDTVAAQVLYRLGLAEGIKRGRQTGRAFGIDNAKRKALHLEESGEQPLEFSCNILVLGKTGVGKSSIINSILGEQLAQTNPFQPSTTSVTEIAGVVDGVNIRFMDTPGLRPSVMDQGYNKKILLSIEKHTKKCPPDIVLYVDRLDTQTRDFNDLPLLRSIAGVLGSSIWFNAIVALTHAASAPPDGPNGTPLGYEVFVAQRSHVVQHSIRQAAGDMRLMNPVALVENHPSCRRNREGQRVLPNGTAWRPQLLLLCYSSKILSEANSLLKLQDPSPGKLFGFRMRSPPLPYLLSSLLQSRAYPKLTADEGGDGVDSDVDLDDLSDSDQEEEVDYDKLPPFKPLKKAQLANLSKEHRALYFDEYEYRVKLLQKKQWREELKRLREMKKRGKTAQYDAGYDDYDQDAAPASVPVPLPDMVLPPTFDCNNPTYRYRFLEPISRLLARPVLDTHGWDHDCGYDGVSLEQSLAILSQFPTSFALQITKDKKEFNVHLDSSAATKLGEGGSGLAGFDIQSVGRQLAYILRSEAKFKNLKKNKTAAGVSMTFLGENVITGLKVENQVVVKKRVCLVGSSGAVRSKGDMAYGANLEARLRPKDHPLEPEIGTLGISLMKWRRDLALGGNAQTQVSLGRNSKMTFRLGLNNKCTGQFSIRTSTSDQLQLALVGVIPVALSIYRNIWSSEAPY